MLRSVHVVLLLYRFVRCIPYFCDNEFQFYSRLFIDGMCVVALALDAKTILLL